MFVNGIMWPFTGIPLQVFRWEIYVLSFVDVSDDIEAGVEVNLALVAFSSVNENFVRTT